MGDKANYYFTARDGFGDDIKDAKYDTFDDALKVFNDFCKAKDETTDGAMIGIVCQANDKLYKCILLQNEYAARIHDCLLHPMHNNISNEALKVPEIELAALYAKQQRYLFDENIQKRIDELEKGLDIFEREVKTDGDLYAGKWRVHIVPPNGRYGSNQNCKNDSNHSRIEFYDMSVNLVNFPNGQFVSSYYVDTLLSDGYGNTPEDLIQYGLCLDMGNANVWSLSSKEMTQVFEWLQNRNFKTGEFFTKYSLDFDIKAADSYAAEKRVRDKLLSIPFLRNVSDVECFGVSRDSVFGVSCNFISQSSKETIERVLNEKFGNSFEIAAWENGCATMKKNSLDDVIGQCKKLGENQKQVKKMESEFER